MSVIGEFLRDDDQEIEIILFDVFPCPDRAKRGVMVGKSGTVDALVDVSLYSLFRRQVPV
nr:hypothetical protein [Candidatus Sigynarchaeum springense]